MLYKFKSKAAGDVIMTEPVGDAVLRAMGLEPSAQGIFEAANLGRLLQALEVAVAVDESQRQPAARDAAQVAEPSADRERVSMKQRAWPLIEMMKRANRAGQDIVWGV